jgi:hypothetical protein
MQCWCRKGDERCSRREAVTDSIDYFGRCQSKSIVARARFSLSLVRTFYRNHVDLGICTEFELEVFPKRMTTWLGEILDTLVSDTRSIFMIR